MKNLTLPSWLRRPRVVTARELMERERDAHLDDLGGQQPTPDDFMKRLVTYIPGEVVGAYIVLSGIVEGALGSDQQAAQDQARTWYWIIFWFLLVIAPIYIWTATPDEGGHQSAYKPYYQAAVAPVAFAAWVYALGGPFKLWLGDEYQAFVGSILLVLISVLITLVDKALDRAARRRGGT